MNYSEILTSVLTALNSIEVKGYQNIKKLSTVIEVLDSMVKTEADREKEKNKEREDKILSLPSNPKHTKKEGE